MTTTIGTPDAAATEATARVHAEAASRVSEARQGFLLALSDRLRPLVDPYAIQREAATVLGERMGANRVGYAEILPDGETSIVVQNYTKGVRSIEGRFRLADYSPALLRELLAGRTMARGDVRNDASLTDAERAAHAAIEVGATVDLPLLKNGRLVAVLFVHYREAHEYTAEEIALIQAVAERTWDAIERARADGALRAAAARLHLAIEVAELGTWSFSLTDGSGFLDARAAQIVGLPSGEFADVARAQAAGTHPDDLAPMQASVAAGIASGEPFDLNYRVVHADGSVHHVASRARVEYDDAGRPVRLVGTNRDVTVERTITERARLLQSLTAAFGAALTPDAVVRVVLEHAVPAFDAITGVLFTPSDDGTTLTTAGSLGYGGQLRDWLARVPIDVPLPAQTAVRERRSIWIEDREAGLAEFPGLTMVYDATGAHATVALPLTDAAGQVIGALAFNFRTARRFDADTRAFFEAVARQCAQALERVRLFGAEQGARRDAERAYAEAEKANRVKAEFLAVMSHELRTPLNAIGGYAELIELGIHGPVTSEQRQALERIQQSQRHLLGLINQVLNYARVDAGAVRYDLIDVPVSEALAAAEALVLPQVRSRGLSFTLGSAPASLLVRADREKLQQILLNLLSNAVKFTEPGGEVRVGCGAADRTVSISVADTGVGISADKLATIFEPFVQVDQRHTRSHEGVGLGLAISRDLARGMGGDLVAESTPGTGSIFTLTLPRP